MPLQHIFNSLRLQRLKSWYSKYERYLMPSALFVGFATDVLTFRLIKFETALVLLFVHVLIIGASIIFINFQALGKIRGKFFELFIIFIPLLMQYAFGSVFSASVIFYSNSGSLSSSWPFILILVFLMIGNEVFKKYYSKSVVLISVYFFAVFSFVLLIMPYVFHKLSAFIFVLSAIFSLIFVGLLIYFLQVKIPKIKEQIRPIILSVTSLFVLMNIFYFANIIPPFPLSLRDIGVYHSVEKISTGNYEVLTEKTKWYNFLLPGSTFHILSDEDTAYVFSSVFAPAKLDLNISHEWQYQDPKSGKWRTSSVVTFRLTGGRNEGYRAYSEKTRITSGKWRVNVKTSGGQIIGRISFQVVPVNEIVDMFFEVK